ncbi:MAG TPA: hypothetical protein VJ875_00155 [Pyrinomonadaceae bacterium]|nr:hypothetical protein [Pyrinomonadaceae bacterium]
MSGVFWARLVLAVLATWRITHLLANEDGPWDLIARVRAPLGSRMWGRLMDCFQCLSLWVALPMAFFVSSRAVEILFTWLALSGAACLLERINQEPLVIQPITQSAEGGTNVGMLRSETREFQSPFIAGNDSASHTAGA